MAETIRLAVASGRSICIWVSLANSSTRSDTIAVRTAVSGTSGTKLSFLAADHHGTSNVAIDAATFATKSLCEHSYSANKNEMEELEAMGAKVHVIDGDEKTEILKTLEPVRSEWAANLDKNGKPATEIVNAFRKLVDEYKGD